MSKNRTRGSKSYWRERTSCSDVYISSQSTAPSARRGIKVPIVRDGQDFRKSFELECLPAATSAQLSLFPMNPLPDKDRRSNTALSTGNARIVICQLFSVGPDHRQASVDQQSRATSLTFPGSRILVLPVRYPTILGPFLVADGSFCTIDSLDFTFSVSLSQGMAHLLIYKCLVAKTVG